MWTNILIILFAIFCWLELFLVGYVVNYAFVNYGYVVGFLTVPATTVVVLLIYAVVVVATTRR